MIVDVWKITRLQNICVNVLNATNWVLNLVSLFLSRCVWQHELKVGYCKSSATTTNIKVHNLRKWITPHWTWGICRHMPLLISHFVSPDVIKKAKRKSMHCKSNQAAQRWNCLGQFTKQDRNKRPLTPWIPAQMTTSFCHLAAAASCHRICCKWSSLIR